MEVVVSNFSLAYPWFLLLLIGIPFLWKWYVRKENSRQMVLKVPSLDGMKKIKPSGKVKMRHWPSYLRMAALVFLIIALARPQLPLGRIPLTIEGIDIILSLDISGSMLAQDFQPDRLRAAQKTAEDFINKRPNDRIGLVVFSGESFTQCPLTSDHNILLHWLENINTGLLQDGTAIGMGLATAVNRLKGSEAKSKVIILMTDGVNNAGYIDPQTAMELAKSEKIRVYTIGIGKNGVAPFPITEPLTGQTVMRQMEVQIDEPLLKSIAKGTGGNYYRATDNKELQKIYATIDQLEKSKIESAAFQPKSEIFYIFAAITLLLLIAELLLKNVYLRMLS